MAKKKPLIELHYPIYEERELDDIMNACRVEDCSFSDLVGKALELYLAQKAHKSK